MAYHVSALVWLQLEGKTRKLKKVWHKLQGAQQEIKDLSEEFQKEREDMLDTIRELNKQLKLKQLLLEAFVPLQDIERVSRASTCVHVHAVHVECVSQCGRAYVAHRVLPFITLCTVPINAAGISGNLGRASR